jgi:hypothetical protein
MDLSKLSPAPWRILESSDKEENPCLLAADNSWLTCGVHSDSCINGLDNAEFIAVARNAFDVMTRRGWHAEKCSESDDWVVLKSLWGGDDALERLCNDEWQKAAYASDPFTALVEADKWYRENVESKGKIT